jgi:hypothetical protein
MRSSAPPSRAMVFARARCANFGVRDQAPQGDRRKPAREGGRQEFVGKRKHPVPRSDHQPGETSPGTALQQLPQTQRPAQRNPQTSLDESAQSENAGRPDIFQKGDLLEADRCRTHDFRVLTRVLHPANIGLACFSWEQDHKALFLVVEDAKWRTTECPARPRG